MRPKPLTERVIRRECPGRPWDPGRWVGEGRGTGPGPHEARSRSPMRSAIPSSTPRGESRHVVLPLRGYRQIVR